MIVTVRSSSSVTGSKRKHRQSVASASLASIVAKRFPMQDRGPPPKG